MEFIKKNIRWIALAFVGIFVFGLGRELIIKLFGDERKVDPLDDNGSQLNDGLADSLAGEIYRAMHGQLGTNEDLLEDIFYHFNSMSDYAKVYNRFGLRYYDPLFGRGGFPIIHPKLNLTEWLNRDLNAADKDILKKKYPQITIW